MEENVAAEHKGLAKERKEALENISGAARYLSPSLQRKLNTALRELVAEIGKLRQQDERQRKKK